jgi:hypothetical protein
MNDMKDARQAMACHGKQSLRRAVSSPWAHASSARWATSFVVRKEAGKRLATLAVDTEVRFPSPTDRAAFCNELTEAITKLVSKYHDENRSRRPHASPGGRGAPSAARIRSQGAIMSVKKEACGRRSVQVEVEVTGSTQSAAARRSAEAELRTLIAKFASAHRRLIGAMRRRLRKRLPTAHEVVYEYRDCFVISYSPNERGYEGVLAIRAGANAVRLYFTRAKELPDPEKMLQGSSQTRWINVEGASTLARPEVARLIDEAVARNGVPFARAGRGSVVIRSTTAKKRRRRRPA